MTNGGVQAVDVWFMLTHLTFDTVCMNELTDCPVQASWNVKVFKY